MAKAVRQVIKIDGQKCNGCGLCVTACAEGALQIIDGKAKLISDTYCDGLGACLGECPQGALSFEEREAEDYNEAAAVAHVMALAKAHSHSHAAHGAGGFVCPSARTIDHTKLDDAPAAVAGHVASELRQWPVKLYLVNPNAPYFADADLLVAADCTAFAYGSFHPEMLRGKVVVTGCPKFDDTQAYLDKLTRILQSNNIRSVTVLQMEVPCCSAMRKITELAVAASGKQVAVETVTVGLEGEIVERAAA